jgi:uncharacterized protein YegL
MNKVEERGIPKEIEEKVAERNKTTELVFILDKSGSMTGMEQDTINGFNAMIEKQKSAEGKAIVSTVLFSNTSEILHDRKPLEEIAPLSEKDYQVGGFTALLDTIGKAITRIECAHLRARPEDVPAHTMFIITTDGLENASKEYPFRQIREMIRRQEEEAGWEFLFVGANIDAVETAARIGIRRERAANYRHDAEGTEMLYCAMSETVTNYRKCAAVRDDWADALDKKKGKKGTKNDG